MRRKKLECILRQLQGQPGIGRARPQNHVMGISDLHPRGWDSGQWLHQRTDADAASDHLRGHGCGSLAQRKSDGIRRRENYTKGNDFMMPENTDTSLKTDCNPRLARYLCGCGSEMIMSRNGYPLCRKTAEEYQAKYRDSIIANTWPTLALCDCRRARKKNGSRVCTEPDYQTHTACPECGQPWSKFILHNAEVSR